MSPLGRQWSGRTGFCHIPPVINTRARSAAFVRGFFLFLEQQGIRAAVLHGGADGFERDLSDVDFVVDRRTYPRLPALIDEYCEPSGWQLCQLLRHETTAAYFVCSCADDPACAVALDACSDYQRNGTVFLSAETLLENRQKLAWGGYGLNPTQELHYRFAKAAAKNKEVAASAAEFTTYPEDVRRDCAAWLHARRNISLRSWDASGIAPVFEKLRAQSKRRPSLTQAGAAGRVLSRILHPTGMVVIAGNDDFEATAARLEEVFGHLYFRRFKRDRRWKSAMLKDLISSTLIIVPQLASRWTKLLPANSIHLLDPASDAATQCQEIAMHLHQRCKKRESACTLRRKPGDASEE